MKNMPLCRRAAATGAVHIDPSLGWFGIAQHPAAKAKQAAKQPRDRLAEFWDEIQRFDEPADEFQEVHSTAILRCVRGSHSVPQSVGSMEQAPGSACACD